MYDSITCAVGQSARANRARAYTEALHRIFAIISFFFFGRHHFPYSHTTYYCLTLSCPNVVASLPIGVSFCRVEKTKRRVVSRIPACPRNVVVRRARGSLATAVAGPTADAPVFGAYTRTNTSVGRPVALNTTTCQALICRKHVARCHRLFCTTTFCAVLSQSCRMRAHVRRFSSVLVDSRVVKLRFSLPDDG